MPPETGREIATTPAPTPIPAVDLLARAAELVFEGKRPMQIARKLGVPYPTAAVLYEQVFTQVYGRIRDRYTPEVLASMKDELADTLLEVIRNCRRAVNHSLREGKPSTRAYTHLNGAVKLLNAMEGFNAPTQSVNVEWKASALVNPEVHARILADPAAREALIRLEEFAADHRGPALPAGGGD